MTTDTLVQQAVRRGEVMKQIHTCTRCAYHTTCHSPVSFRGPAPSSYMMVGDAPSVLDDRIGKPFTGGMGKELAQWFIDARLPDFSRWFITNAVCCKPTGNAPEKFAIVACGKNLTDQLHLANPEWVLLLGAKALAATGVKTKIGQVHGRPFLMPAGPFIGRWLFPTYHPAAGWRDAGAVSKIKEDLNTLAKILNVSTTTSGGNDTLARLEVRVGKRGTVIIPG